MQKRFTLKHLLTLLLVMILALPLIPVQSTLAAPPVQGDDEDCEGSLDAYYEIGFDAYDSDDAERGIEAFTCIIQLDDVPADVAYAQTIRAEMYTWIENYAAAIEDYTLAIESGTLDAPDLAYAYSGRAYAYYQQNESAAAIEDYTRLLENPPHEDAYLQEDALLFRGLTYLDQEDFETALTDLDTFIAQGAETVYYLPIAYLARGQAYYALNQDEQAIEDFTAALAFADEEGDAGEEATEPPVDQESRDLLYLLRAGAYYYTNQEQAALDDLAEISDNAFADDAVLQGEVQRFRGLSLYYLGDDAEAVEYLTQAIELYESDAEDNQGLLAETYAFRGQARFFVEQSKPEEEADYTATIDDFMTAVGLGIEDEYLMSEIYNYRGLAELYSGDLNAAVDAFQWVIDYSDERVLLADAYLYLGEAQFSLNDDEAALNSYTHSLQLEPDDPFSRAYALLQRGMAYYYLEDDANALVDFDAAREVEGVDDPLLDSYLDSFTGQSYFYLDNYNETVDYLSRSLDVEADIDDPLLKLDNYRFRGMAYVLNGEDEKAVEDLTRVIDTGLDAMLLSEMGMEDDLNWMKAEAHLFRGMANFFLENDDMAMDDLTQAIELDAEGYLIPDAAFYRGQVYFFQGDYRRAVNDLSTTIEAYPDDAWAYLYRGLAHEELGNEDDAQADFDRAIELDPELADEVSAQTRPDITTGYGKPFFQRGARSRADTRDRDTTSTRRGTSRGDGVSSSAGTERGDSRGSSRATGIEGRNVETGEECVVLDEDDPNYDPDCEVDEDADSTEASDE